MKSQKRKRCNYLQKTFLSILICGRKCPRDKNNPWLGKIGALLLEDIVAIVVCTMIMCNKQEKTVGFKKKPAVNLFYFRRNGVTAQ